MNSGNNAPRYFMHKYWGKKPASGISPLIDKYTNPGDTIMDRSVIYINTCLNMQIPIQSLSPFFHIISNGVSCLLRLCTGYGSYPNIAAGSDSPGA